MTYNLFIFFLSNFFLSFSIIKLFSIGNDRPQPLSEKSVLMYEKSKSKIAFRAPSGVFKVRGIRVARERRCFFARLMFYKWRSDFSARKHFPLDPPNEILHSNLFAIGFRGEYGGKINYWNALSVSKLRMKMKLKFEWLKRAFFSCSSDFLIGLVNMSIWCELQFACCRFFLRNFFSIL